MPIAPSITLRDIAARLKVSHTTVSLALRNDPSISEKRRKEVKRVAEQMSYRPDPMLSSLVQYRIRNRPSAVPEPLRAASAKFRATLVGVLLNLSDHVEGKSDRAMPDLPSALAELEKTVTAQINTVTDANVAAQIRARLALYQETVPFALKLIRLQAG